MYLYLCFLGTGVDISGCSVSSTVSITEYGLSAMGDRCGCGGNEGSECGRSRGCACVVDGGLDCWVKTIFSTTSEFLRCGAEYSFQRRLNAVILKKLLQGK